MVLGMVTAADRFFPFRVDPISEGVTVQEPKQEFLKVVYFVNMAENLPNAPSPRTEMNDCFSKPNP